MSSLSPSASAAAPNADAASSESSLESSSLLDSHSTRKGATNAGAQGGLLQESCEALGQSVHHTVGCWRYLLKRYFKEHNAGVASVQPLKNHLNLNINVSTGLIDDYPVDRRTAQSVSCGILVRARLGPVQ